MRVKGTKNIKRTLNILITLLGSWDQDGEDKIFVPPHKHVSKSLQKLDMQMSLTFQAIHSWKFLAL